jgi:hypothetical protein
VSKAAQRVDSGLSIAPILATTGGLPDPAPVTAN